MTTSENANPQAAASSCLRSRAVWFIVVAEVFIALCAFGWSRQLTRRGLERAVALVLPSGREVRSQGHVIRVSSRQAMSGLLEFRFTRELCVAGRNLALPKGIDSIAVTRGYGGFPRGASLSFTLVGRVRSAVVAFPLRREQRPAEPFLAFGQRAPGSLEISWVHVFAAHGTPIRPFVLYAPAWAKRIIVHRIQKSGLSFPLGLLCLGSMGSPGGVRSVKSAYLFVGSPRPLPEVAASRWVRHRFTSALALAGAPPWELRPLADAAYSRRRGMAPERWFRLAIGVGHLSRGLNAARVLASIAYFRRSGPPFGRVFLFNNRGWKLYLDVSGARHRAAAQPFFLFDRGGLLAEWGQITMLRPGRRFRGIGLAAGLCGLLSPGRGTAAGAGPTWGRRRHK